MQPITAKPAGSSAGRIAAALALAVFCLPAPAQDKFPSRALTIVVPFGPGSSSDVGVRQLAGKLQPRFGQPIIVENRAGAGATLGAAYVAKAKPDGYTIAYGSTSGFSAAPGMVKSLPYDPVRDFSSITIIAEQYFTLLTRAEFKGSSFPEFIERMRKNPDGFAVGGQSASYETLNKMMTDAGKLGHLWVPYAEAGRMMNDLMGGRLGGVMVPLNLALASVKSGQGHIAAVSSMERLSYLPSTYTMHETLPGVYINSFTGYFAPAKTPRPVINALYSFISETLKDPDILRRNEEGGRPLFLTPDESDAYLRKDVPRWTMLLKAAGIKPE